VKTSTCVVIALVLAGAALAVWKYNPGNILKR
jgi:hypothetical protein